jgi:hypothetical protein
MRTVKDRRWCRKRTVDEIRARDVRMAQLLDDGWSLNALAQVTCLTRAQVINRLRLMGTPEAEIDRGR